MAQRHPRTRKRLVTTVRPATSRRWSPWRTGLMVGMVLAAGIAAIFLTETVGGALNGASGRAQRAEPEGREGRRQPPPLPSPVLDPPPIREKALPKDARGRPILDEVPGVRAFRDRPPLPEEIAAAHQELTARQQKVSRRRPRHVAPVRLPDLPTTEFSRPRMDSGHPDPDFLFTKPPGRTGR